LCCLLLTSYFFCDFYLLKEFTPQHSFYTPLFLLAKKMKQQMQPFTWSCLAGLPSGTRLREMAKK